MTANGDVFLDRKMRGWLANTARANFWRVASWYDLADLIQDGYLAFAKCRAKYDMFKGIKDPTQEQRKHFMALVQTTYIKQIIDLANERTSTKETHITETEFASIADPVGWTYPETVADLAMASGVVKELVAKVVDPQVNADYRTTKLCREWMSDGSFRYVHRKDVPPAEKRLISFFVGWFAKRDLVKELEEQLG